MCHRKISVIIAKYRERVIIKICDDHSSQFSVFGGLVGVKLQDLIIIALCIDMICFAVRCLYSHDAVFLIGIPCHYLTPKLSLQRIPHHGGHAFRNRYDRCNAELRGIYIVFINIPADLTERRRIADQAFYPLSVHDIQHLFDRGTVKL